MYSCTPKIPLLRRKAKCAPAYKDKTHGAFLNLKHSHVFRRNLQAVSVLKKCTQLYYTALPIVSANI